MSKFTPPLRAWQPGAPCLYLLVGPPASGKSTWVAQHLSSSVTPTHVASTDDILERFAKEQNISYSEAHRMMFKLAEREFKQGIISAAAVGKDIVVDRTNVSPNARRKMFALVDSSTKFPYTRIGVVFSAPNDVLQERLAERHQRTGKYVPWAIVEGMIRDYVEPNEQEFHFIRHP